MRVSSSVSRLLCASVSSACGAHVCDDLATPGHRQIRQFADGVVGALAVQQFDRLAQQIRGVLARPAVEARCSAG